MIKVWLHQIIRSRLFVYAAESSLLAVVLLYAAWHAHIGAGEQFMGESLGLLIVLLSCQFCLHLNGVDELIVDSEPQIFLRRTLKSIGAGLILAALFFYIFPRVSPGYIAAAVSALMLAFGFALLRPIVRALVRHQKMLDGTLILGSDDRAGKVYQELIRKEEPDRIRIVRYADLGRLANQDSVSRIVVADPDLELESELAEALIDCKLRGVRIESAVDSFEKTNRQIWLEGLSAEWLIFADGFSPSKLYRNLKRAFDVFFAAALLLFTAPLMAIIAVAIKLESSGSAIFRQERVGLHGKRFTLYKFRSMHDDAEKLSGPAWAKEKDNRITNVGRWLRQWRLDELPQLVNVLRGEMSFIGPRPERPHFVDLLKSHIHYYDLRRYVKPGITGWAQVMYPYGASIEDAYHKLQYDLYYAKNISLRLDLRIILKTFKVVISGEGR